MKKTEIKAFVDKVANLNVEFNTIKKELEADKTELKKYAAEHEVDDLDGADYVAHIDVRQKPVLNQAKALEVVKKAKAKWLLVEHVDETKLEEAIRAGEIDAKLFKDCYDVKTSEVLTFKARKAETAKRKTLAKIVRAKKA